MKHFLIFALAALVILQASSAFKIKRIIYVVPATTTTTASPTSATTTTTAAPAVVQQVIFCSWKNNWCRPANSVRNCKWGLCKFNG
ncbi:uncharacterized protein LOC122319892 [Drosophila ficusphila]|uniref:uncharacterized protein LOC122319892 n=1 Tax=Drosophila ficusphila TaxID=30025 RepID=UPI001C899BA8|nr:uncharacterized protein LOC122319892 [Drosophila ficusphila]